MGSPQTWERLGQSVYICETENEKKGDPGLVYNSPPGTFKVLLRYFHGTFTNLRLQESPNTKEEPSLRYWSIMERTLYL